MARLSFRYGSYLCGLLPELHITHPCLFKRYFVIPLSGAFWLARGVRCEYNRRYPSLLLVGGYGFLEVLCLKSEGENRYFPFYHWMRRVYSRETRPSALILRLETVSVMRRATIVSLVDVLK